MFLSATEVLITVIRMQRVSTHLEVLGVCVTLGSLEMDLHAQVIYLTCSKPSSPPLFPGAVLQTRHFRPWLHSVICVRLPHS